MMQAFRNSAKVAGAIFAILMLVFVLTSVDWSGLTMTTTVGKINGESIDARTYQGFVQQTIDNRQRDLPASLTLEERNQIEDQVWEQLVESRVPIGRRSGPLCDCSASGPVKRLANAGPRPRHEGAPAVAGAPGTVS